MDFKKKPGRKIDFRIQDPSFTNTSWAPSLVISAGITPLIVICLPITKWKNTPPNKQKGASFWGEKGNMMHSFPQPTSFWASKKRLVVRSVSQVLYHILHWIMSIQNRPVVSSEQWQQNPWHDIPWNPDWFWGDPYSGSLYMNSDQNPPVTWHYIAWFTGILIITYFTPQITG